MAENTNDLEPVDMSKKLRIQEVLEPDLDTAIVKLANTRKQTPLRCIKSTREVANNNISYYGEVCVVSDREKEMLSFTTEQVDSVCKADAADEIPENLDSFSKVISECLAERHEFLKAKHLINQKLATLPGRKRPQVHPQYRSNDFIVNDSD